MNTLSDITLSTDGTLKQGTTGEILFGVAYPVITKSMRSEQKNSYSDSQTAHCDQCGNPFLEQKGKYLVCSSESCRHYQPHL